MDSNKLTKYEKSENLRVFACMNPAFEIGKKELPESLKIQFTKLTFQISNEFQEIRIIV